MRDVAYRSSAAANVTKMITAAAVVIHCGRVIVLAPLLSAQRKRVILFRDTGSNHPQKSGLPQSGKLLYRFHRNGGMGLLVFALSLVCILVSAAMSGGDCVYNGDPFFRVFRAMSVCFDDSSPTL